MLFGNFEYTFRIFYIRLFLVFNTQQFLVYIYFPQGTHTEHNYL